MLSPERLEQLTLPMLELFGQVEEDILKDVARRIAKTGRLTDTAQWQLSRHRETEALRKDIAAILSRYSGKTEQTIREILRTAGKEDLLANEQAAAAAGVEHSGERSPMLENLLTAGYRQTRGTWYNLTGTIANTVTQQFENELSRAWLQVSTGAFDYETAIRGCVDRLAAHMDGVTYPSGHHDTLEVACRRAILTGVNQTAAKLTLAQMEQEGWEFVEVTAHSGARPEHAEWHGRVFHRGGAVTVEGTHYPDFEKSTGYGTGAGLCGWNCRHNFFPFWPGLSEPAWNSRRLEQLNARNILYNGKQYSRYEISQMQRALERKVRAAKRKWLAEDAAGLDSTQAAVELRTAREKLREFTYATNSRPDPGRTGVSGFGRSAAGRARWDERKRQVILAQHKNGSKVYITEQAISKVKPISPSGFTKQNAAFVYQTHKDLLRHAKEKNNSNEVACLVDLKTNTRLNYIDGDGETVNIYSDTDTFHMLRTNENSSLMLCHNHPGLSYFSMNDIRIFLENDSLRTMSIVTNQGKVEYINKTDGFSRRSAIGELRSLFSENESNPSKTVALFLKKRL